MNTTTRIRSPFFRVDSNTKVIRNAARQDEADILIYDEIGGFGVEAGEFVRALQSIDAATVRIRINSPGGSVFDGIAIANGIRDYKARTSTKVIVHIDALAASIASVVALAGDEIRMAENAFFMIHDPWTLTVGNAKELRQVADLLEKVNAATVLPAYVAKTGKTEDEVKAWMADETWFTAAEAKAHGFIDEIEKKSTVKAAFDLSVFAKAPAALAESDAELTKRELERILRDAGMSRDDAKALIADGYNALTQRDAVPDAAIEELHTAAKALLAKLAA